MSNEAHVTAQFKHIVISSSVTRMGCLLAPISPRGKITAKKRQDTYQGGDKELNFGVFGYETALYRPFFGKDIPYSHGKPPSFEIVVFACSTPRC
jgi:hypothetical protein